VALYVLALTDTPLSAWTVGAHRLESLQHDGVHVVFERRAASPAVTDTELREQHALVLAIAARTRAILPARFGSLIEKRQLTALLRRHEADVRAALEQVRDRVQMTVRVTGSAAPSPSAPVVSGALSGRDYLERARLKSSPPLPRQAQRVLSAVQPYVVSERREPGAGRLLGTIYHLVDDSQLADYRKAVGKRVPGVIVSGPWPPFAFSPQLW